MNHFFICQHCDKTFKDSKNPGNNPKFCSMVCFRAFQKSKWITKACLKCGSEFTHPPAKAKGKKFCSSACSNRYHKVANPANRSVFTCEWCKKEFEEWTYRKPRFCSLQCGNEWRGNLPQSGRPHDPDNWIVLFCKWCKKEYKLSAAYFRLRGSRFCSVKCKSAQISIEMLGENNPNWKGGFDPSDYGPHWHKTAKEIRERDNHACQLCGYLSGGNRSLDVHHIIPLIEFSGDWQAANLSSNLISLCRLCHRKVESKKVACPVLIA